MVLVDCWRILWSVAFGLLDDDDAFHLGVKGASVWKIAGVSERITPRLPRGDRAGIKGRRSCRMRDHIIVAPLNNFAILHLDRHRIKLKILDRNLNDGGGNGGRNRFDGNLGVDGVTGSLRANHEPGPPGESSAKAGKPESRRSVTCTRRLL